MSIVNMDFYGIELFFIVHFFPPAEMKVAYATLRRANVSICSHQRNAAQGGEGLVQKKANMPHFSELQHPLPLKNPPLLRALPVAWDSQSVKGNFISRRLHCSRDLFWDEAKKLVCATCLGFNTLNLLKRQWGHFFACEKSLASS